MLTFFFIPRMYDKEHHFSHPSTNQARPCLASEIRWDRARSGCYGLRPRLLPPGALRALHCTSVSLWTAGQPFRLQVILLPPLSLPAFWESLSFHTWWCNEWMPYIIFPQHFFSLFLHWFLWIHLQVYGLFLLASQMCCWTYQFFISIILVFKSRIC